MHEAPAKVVDELYRRESRRVFATLVRLLGDFDLAEEALHEAFRAALEQWPREGVPRNPRAWLVSAGRFKAIDAVRRQRRFEVLDDEMIDTVPAEPQPEREEIEDDRLRLIFTCCHPALAPEAQVALTLREVCGLATEEIARAFLSTAPTLAQRIVRAKAKIRDARIPYEVPGPGELPERLDAVLQVIYLVFNEGYSASSGASLMRADLSQEAIRVGRLLVQLLPEPEAIGLLALMLIQESRRAARTTADGDLVLLEDQDRSLWDRALIREGVELTTRALRSGFFGPYSLQAAIAAVHAEGTFHRDLSPDNILLPSGDLDRAVIIDFGIAKLAEPQAGTLVGGDIAGKASYMSPEQLGVIRQDVDARSDIYSLALTIAAAVRGRSLNAGGSWAEVVEARRQVPDLEGIGEPLRGRLAAAGAGAHRVESAAGARAGVPPTGRPHVAQK